MTDSFDLQRFLDARSSVYPRVLAKLRRGQKQSHWMWFSKLPASGIVRWRSGLPSLRAGRPLPIQGMPSSSQGMHRSRQCRRWPRHTRNPRHSDDLKFRSSMTLFGAVLTVRNSSLPFRNFRAEDHTKRRWTCLGARRVGTPFPCSCQVCPSLISSRHRYLTGQQTTGRKRNPA
jgi:hypothetical protein